MLSVREESCQRAVSSMTSVDTSDASNETHIHTCPRWVCVYCPVPILREHVPTAMASLGLLVDHLVGLW